MTKLLKERV
jgi:hypothetical protein